MTLFEWRKRKAAQIRRFVERYPFLGFEAWQDFETKFVLIIPGRSALVIGQLAQDGVGAVDLSDEQIGEWVSKYQPCQSPA